MFTFNCVIISSRLSSVSFISSGEAWSGGGHDPAEVGRGGGGRPPHIVGGGGGGIHVP